MNYATHWCKNADERKQAKDIESEAIQEMYNNSPKFYDGMGNSRDGLD